MSYVTKFQLSRWAVAGAVLVSSAAVAQDEDAPRRIVIERMHLSGDVIEVGACAMRLMGRSAKVTGYPVRDGVGFDWTPKTGAFFSSPGDPIISMEFRTEDDGAYLSARYRHPFSNKAAKAIVRRAAKICFKNDWNAWAITNSADAIE